MVSKWKVGCEYRFDRPNSGAYTGLHVRITKLYSNGDVGAITTRPCVANDVGYDWSPAGFSKAEWTCVSGGFKDWAKAHP